MALRHEAGLVSVIVPTYNRADLIAETLDSVRAQTYRPIEVLIVDDGSTDGTAAAVEQWTRHAAGSEGLQLRYLSGPNRGAGAARNVGLAASCGEYIQFLDSDDLLHPDKLTLQVGELAADRRLAFAYSETAIFHQSPCWEAPADYGAAPHDLVADFVARPVWKTESGLYRRPACIANGPWDERLSVWDDWEYNVRFALSGPRIARVAGVLSLAREHGGGRLSDLTVRPAGIEAILRAVCRVDDLLAAAGCWSAGVRRALGSRYLLVAHFACVAGMAGVVRQAARRGLRLRSGVVKWCEFQLLRRLAGLPRPCGAGTCRLVAALAAGVRKRLNVSAVREGCG
jgi:hypothetical protein